MRLFYIVVFFLLLCVPVLGQKNIPSSTALPNADNIYTIKQQFLYNILHNPTEQEGEDDSELARFNRWFNDVEIRCYPTGNLPRPDVILTATREADRLRSKSSAKTTSGPGPWAPIGPTQVPGNSNGIGRINCIVIDPLDSGTLYIGAACGGVFISHDDGNTWTSHSDNFPSLSIADIAVNPHHTDTIYAATGDGYGYEDNSYNVFWGGLYSAGIMMSADGGNTWNTTGLSFLQSSRDIIQRLLINPNHPNILLAATRYGILRTTDAGATWDTVDGGHVYSMQFKPNSPDTVYAINTNDLRVSYDAGLTWRTLSAGLNPTGDRCTIAVSPVSPNAVWMLDSHNNLQWSHNQGHSFTPTAQPDTAHFYGYYDRVLAISPTDSNYILAFGSNMGLSTDGGTTWGPLNARVAVHVDNHAVAINPLKTTTIYCGNDGGISVTYDGGLRWKNLGNGLMISQIYRIGVSQQNPYVMVCGLQDNGSNAYDATNWNLRTGGDGEACAIHPLDDELQISSWQNGHFYMSYDQGVTFTALNVSTQTAAWTAPVAFDPNNEMNIYFGYQDIFVTYDQGTSFVNLTHDNMFSSGATILTVAPSNSSVIYAGDMSNLVRSTDAGATWHNVTGNLPTADVALTHVTVDPRNANLIYATMSGYLTGTKVFMSTSGGTSWTNISGALPNIPADCIAVDTTTPGALFVGTDIGVYYQDSTSGGWSLYSTGLPNVIVNDLDVNYGNYKIRAATYGRGVWECNLRKSKPVAVHQIKNPDASISVYPNPSSTNWKLVFWQKPGTFNVRVTDVTGRVVSETMNTDIIDASRLSSGVYNIEVSVGDDRYNLKAVRE